MRGSGRISAAFSLRFQWVNSEAFARRFPEPDPTAAVRLA